MTDKEIKCGYKGCEEKPTHGVIMGMDKNFLGFYCYEHAESTSDLFEELGQETRIVTSGEIAKAALISNLRGSDKLEF